MTQEKYFSFFLLWFPSLIAVFSPIHASCPFWPRIFRSNIFSPLFFGEETSSFREMTPRLEISINLFRSPPSLHCLLFYKSRTELPSQLSMA